MVLIELCVQDLDGVRAARSQGADRVELCVNLECGGLTPPLAMIDDAVPYAPKSGLQILVRPRPGSFVLRDGEAADIARTIEGIRTRTESAPVTVGFVVGGLTDCLEIDREAAARWRDAAGERPLTYHRAFDQVADHDRALNQLMELGYDRVLTTGGHPTQASIAGLRRLCEHAGDSLVVLASGGLRAHNVASVIAQTGVHEVHMRAPGADGKSTDSQLVGRIVAEVRGGTL